MKIETKAIYICSFCGRKSVKEDVIEKCEVKCREKYDSLSKLLKDAEALRNTVSSITELGNKLSQLLTDYCGVKCEVDFIGGSFLRTISNTHSAPFGKETNWDRTPDKPRGYPGWSGNVDIRIEGGYDPTVSDTVRKINRQAGFYIGCGGARPHGLHYTCTLWADDFPKMGNKILKYLDARDESGQYYQEERVIAIDYRDKCSDYVKSHPQYAKKLEELESLERELIKQFSESQPIPPVKCKKVTVEYVNELYNELI